MNFNLKVSTWFEFVGTHLLFVILMSGTFFFLFGSLWAYDVGYSQENHTNSNSNSTLLAFQSRNIPEFLDGSYSNLGVGIHIMLPGGWKGINFENVVMVSPAGVHLMNGNLGPSGDKVLMVIEVLNISDFLDQRKAYGDIQKSDCNVLSDKFVTINEVDGQELFLQCGASSDNKIVNYFFASGNKVIVVGLKGSGSVFDRNLNKFMNSVSTLSMDKPTDIRNIG
jgi:hypothetical protein